VRIARPFQMPELSQARAVHPCAMYKNFASARFELAFALFLAVVVRTRLLFPAYSHDFLPKILNEH
jgi:hypothetical protein